MVKENKTLTLKDFISSDIQKKLNQNLENLESRKISLEKELDIKKEELIKIIQEVNREIEQKIKIANDEIQKKNSEADKLLKSAKEKLKTAEKREKESIVIEGQIEELNKKSDNLKIEEKEFEKNKVICLEKERKAELLIEQYEKKLKELEELNNKK